MADDPTQHPPPDAYNRLTNPERYAVLHQAAHSLLEQLEQDYVVGHLESTALDPDLTGRVATEILVRLQPPPGQGAPLTVAFTEFPGLLVRFGRWHKEAFPRCGCDACDESPAELMRKLADEVGCLVAGRFREEIRIRPLRKAVLRCQFSAEDWIRSSEELLERTDRRLRLAQPGETNWPPWTRR